MRKQIVVVTKQRAVVCAVMEKNDFSTDIPTADQMEEFARQALENRFPEIDATDWDGIYRLGSPVSSFMGSWGVVKFTLTS